MPKMVSNISPVINSVHRIYDKLLNEKSDHFIQLLETNLFWTQKLCNNFIESLKLLKGNQNNSKKNVNNILSLQMISSSLEQSLGNIVLTEVNFVPPLLKDLLRLPELSQIIGNNSIVLLQLLMGPPFSINIRNILWHGFVSDQDIDQRFAYFLLCISVTIGFDLEDKFRNQILPQRPLIVFGQQLNAWNSMFPILESNDLSLISRTVLQNSPFISKRMLSLWKYAFHLYNNNQFGYSIAIIFPQMESCLRFIYSIVNNMNDRIMTAIAREYYITFAEILSPTLTDSQEKNQFYSIFNQSLIELLLDIIIIPTGPKIRDKLSHGQIDVFAVERYVANHVICSAISLIVWAHIQFNNSNDYKSVDIINNILKTANNYKCLFHPLSQLRTKIIEFAESISELEVFRNKFLRDQTLINSTQMSQNIDKLLERLNNLAFSQTCECLNTELNVMNKLNNYNLNIVSNPKSESEVILFRQIVDNILQSSQNIISFLNLRQEQYSQKKLRSRQRLNFTLIIANLDLFRNTFLAILLFLYIVFIDVLKFSKTQNEVNVKTLQQIVSLSQNMNSSSRLTVNKWDKCEILCNKMCSFLYKLLL
jgi:hypothetical protein